MAEPSPPDASATLPAPVAIVSPAGRRRVHLPRWTWSYVTFRFGDGVTSGLIPLAAVLHYREPLWALALLTAVMNLAGVPATFLWGKLMDGGTRRRPIVVTGFAVTSLALALLSSLPPFPLFVGGAILYTVFGVATAPAASTMVLQRVPRARWGRTTAALSRRTGFAYLAGMVTSIVIAAPSSWWAALSPALGTIAASGIVGGPHFQGQFAASALMSASAAILASQLVPAWQPPLPHEAGFEPVQATQRRFERSVFFPGRMFSAPTLRAVAASLRDPHRLWPLGYAFTFMGSVCFFASYPGVLSGPLGLAPGLVLLAQLPSNLVTPITYPWAGRWGAHVGEPRGILHGSVLRTATLPVLALAVAGVGTRAYPLLLVLHGIMGLSFALIQVNGPVLLAGVHPGGRGQGVGTYHAAVGAGTLLGSLLAAVLLAVLPYGWSYVFAVAAAGVGCLLLWTARRQPARPVPAA
ncbi:MAG: hypothetical protein LC620_03665 [Halobacteriales archaeon]|nr:hypothetical protein [Halobacteriales archaeon]